MSKPKAPLHIFNAGRHQATDGQWYDFSEADIADAVASYDPILLKAPLVVGHPKTNSPSYGWAKSLAADGGGLFAEPENVNPEFAELVNKKTYPRISTSFYLPDSPGNPKPGHFYVRHIGFLGGAAPAVKGLREAEFADGDGAVEFAQPMSSLGWSLKSIFQSLRDWFIDQSGVDAADKVIPQWAINSFDELRDPESSIGAAFAEPHLDPETQMGNDTKPNAADFAEREQQLNTRNADIERREAALKKREDDTRRADAVEFAESLVTDGKLLPRHKDAIVDVLLALPAGTTIDFAEADGQAAKKTAAADVLRSVLSDLPKAIDFSEKSGDPNRGGVEAGTVDFAAPAGEKVDPQRLEIHNKALAYQRQHPNTAYLAAVKAVGG